MSRRLYVILAVLMLADAVVARSATLNIGDKPPALDVGLWIRKPAAPAKANAIRIVTFFSTWSEPCREAFPVLRRVAERHKNVTIEAVSVYEKSKGPTDTAYYAAVKEFVRRMGAQMPYAVGVDGPQGRVARAWLEASGERGVPTSFIIDRNGKIIWIGHTLMLDATIDQIAAGRYDAKRYAEERSRRIAEEEKEYRLFKRFNELNQQGRYKEAVDELDRITKVEPEYGRRMVLVRFSLLLRCNEPEAYRFGRQLLNGELKNESGLLWLMARMLLDETPGLKSPDYRLAYDLALRSAELTKYQDANILTALAYANFKLGNVDRAIELQEQAIPIGDANPEIPERNKQLMRSRLEMFRKARSGK